MGAGQFNAGDGLGGEDPLPSISAPRDVTPPAALYFNGATADNPLDARGLYLAVHPVDAAVELALLIRHGTLASTPELGNRLREIRRLGPTTADKVRDFIRQALATLLASGAITLRAIEVEVDRRAGQIRVATTYVNNRTSTAQTRRTVINGS